MVREARPEDAAAIARVHTETWQIAYRGIVPDEILDGLEVSEGRIAASLGLIEDESVQIFVADDDELRGFVSAGRSRDLESEGEIYAIYVHPSAWGRGFGRELMAAAEQSLRTLGFAEAALWVLADNARARRFYEAAGWTLEDGARKAVPAGTASGLIEVRYRRRL